MMAYSGHIMQTPKIMSDLIGESISFKLLLQSMIYSPCSSSSSELSVCSVATVDIF
jgi:hypothetical protein